MIDDYLPCWNRKIKSLNSQSYADSQVIQTAHGYFIKVNIPIFFQNQYGQHHVRRIRTCSEIFVGRDFLVVLGSLVIPHFSGKLRVLLKKIAIRCISYTGMQRKEVL